MSTFFNSLCLINGYKLFIIILFILIYSIDILSNRQYNILFPKSLILDGNNINAKIQNIDYLIENIKINDEKFLPNNSCFQTDNKIFWKNNVGFEIEKLKEEIKNSKSLEINFENSTQLYKRENPKISLIITIYNQGYYIFSSYAFIQKQELKDIEIIFVDDASSDNSSLIIKELMRNDKRIIYLKNFINKKQFYSINLGILYSKGEYILSVDPDDLILNNILLKSYETARYYNLDVVQFYILKNMTLWASRKYKSGIMCSNKNIRNIFYSGISRNLPDKLIKREIYIKSIKFMKRELYHMDYQIHTDDTIFFGLIHFIKSYGFLEEIGYFYNIDPNRRPKMNIKKDRSMIIIEKFRSLFNIMKYFIIQSDNNTIEKYYAPYKFFENNLKFFEESIDYIKEEFEFYIEVLNIYIDCSFFTNKQKDLIIKFKKKILIRQKFKNNNK